MMEEHEEIPWSMLVDHDRRARTRTWYVAAAAILVVAVLIAGWRWIGDHRHGETPQVAPPITSTTATIAPTTTALLSEADLRAVEPGAAELAAMARAEWFVTDYFTMDGAPAPELLSAFADDAVLPALPQLDDAAGVSVVEWARAYAFRPDPAGYVVTVLFRTLYRNQDDRYERSPVRAVDVVVLVDEQQTAVADLPVPSEVPVAQGLSGWAGSTSGVAMLEDPSGVELPVGR
jgi:hypothetical protein